MNIYKFWLGSITQSDSDRKIWAVSFLQVNILRKYTQYTTQIQMNAHMS
jgi:hypothetical protein